MREVQVKGSKNSSQIFVGDCLPALANKIPSEKVVIISDTRVHELYSAIFPKCPVIKIGQGEEHKSLETLQSVVNQLLDIHLSIFLEYFYNISKPTK